VPDSEQDVAANTQGNTPYVPKLTPEMEARKWKPGESGNMSGRPKRKPLTDAYAALLDKPIPSDMARQLKLDESTTYAQVIAMSLVREAVKGKVQAAAEVADRVEGKITQPISGADGGAIQIVSTIPRHSGTIEER
jgi:hypothetical protein